MGTLCISLGLAESLAYPSGEEGVTGNFLVQIISTCLAPRVKGGGEWGSAPCALKSL
jgi:hypothetical protein